MNIVGRLTVRHMMMNKKRTLVTMVGVIISVAMIMAVSTIAYSFTAYMGEREMENSGQFHVAFEKVPYENRDIIFEGSNIGESFCGKVVGDYSLEEIEADKESEDMVADDESEEQDAEDELPGSERVFRLLGLDESGFDKIVWGEMDGARPSNDSELMVSLFYSDMLGISEVGDTVKLGGKEYTVSGIYYRMDIETRYVEIEGKMAYALYTRCDTESMQEGDYINIWSMLKDLGTDIYDDIKELAEESGCESYYTNRDVLYYYGIGEGSFGRVMDTMKYTLIAIIMVAAIALIANGFSISLSERSRYLGMLASVGATRAQKRYSVFFEGFLIGAVSIPFGILSGWLGTVITFKVIEDKIYSMIGEGTKPVTVQVQPLVIIVTILFSVLTIFLSAYIPARRASKITPIDAIRGTKDIKIKGRQVKTRSITGKIFGFEGELALKNLKRNKKKYGITVLSLAVSVILFLTVYSFVYYMNLSMEMVFADTGYDMYGQIYGETKEEKEEIVKRIRRSEEGTEIVLLHTLYGVKGLMTKEQTMQYADSSAISYYEDPDQHYVEELTNYELCFLTCDEEYMRSFLERIGLSYEEFRSDKNNIIILNSATQRLYDESGTARWFSYKFLDCKRGDTIKAVMNKDSDNYFGEAYDKWKEDYTSYTDEIELTVYACTEEEYLGDTAYSSYYGPLKVPVLLTEEMYEYLLEQAKTYAAGEDLTAFEYSYFYLTGGNQEGMLERIGELAEQSGAGLWGNSYYEQNKSMKDMLFLVQVFTYGFIVLMTLVCAANIFNTISTSVTLRRREFATLRSVGMTKKVFNRMIFFESGFYGMKALLYGLPISAGIMLFLYNNLSDEFEMGFSIPWSGVCIVTVSVFLVVGSSMMYAAARIKRENIIDTLRDENI